MDVESQTQKHLVSFCKTLPVHVDSWKSVLQDSAKPLDALSNFCMQHRNVKIATLDSLENCGDAKRILLSQISTRIEEELLNIKEIIDKLNKLNIDLKNKLLVFERSTLALDWEQNSELIRGSASQPQLSRLLQEGLEFLNFFMKHAKNITDTFRKLDVNREECIRGLQEAFDVNLENGAVTTLIALTQYVDNTKAIM